VKFLQPPAMSPQLGEANEEWVRLAYIPP
jgi:hypothetical protein